MQTERPHILIFDSGVGALSVFQEIFALEPDIHCTVAMDNAGFPYGTMAESVLIERVVRLVGHLIKLTEPQLVVIACNTASTVVLDELRKEYDVPFVGVVPAIKPAAQQSSSQTIGLLATPATVERSYTDNLIEDFAPGCTIVRVGSTDMVYISEQKIRGKAVKLDELQKIIQPILDNEHIDTLVLACTHFPLIKHELAKILPEHIEILDSGSAIAKRVSSLIKKDINNSPSTEKPNHHFYLTSDDADIAAINSYSEKLGFLAAETLKL